MKETFFATALVSNPQGDGGNDLVAGGSLSDFRT
jgi:hypothetical protein